MSLPLVTNPETVREWLDKPHIKPIDVRNEEHFTAAHLPRAQRLEPAWLNRSDPPVAGLLPDRHTVNQELNALGIQPGDHLIACDSGTETAAARLIWVLHAYGFTHCSWLAGGVRGWLAAGGERVTGAADAVATGTLDLVPEAHNVVSVDALLGELDDPALAILDVRSRAEYEGNDVRAAMGGHVPGAVHQEWTAMLSPDGRPKPPEILRSELESLGITPDRKVVVYCQSHQRSSVTYVLLKALGYANVRALDGAWSAWGNRSDTPKER